MKQLISSAVLSLAVFAAQAGISVVVAHDNWGADGFPEIAEGEQVSVFWCIKPAMSSADLTACAIANCKKYFKGATANKPDKCAPDGFANKAGYSIISVGNKSDNQFIFSKAIGDPDRDTALKFVHSNKFKAKNYVLDAYDDHRTVNIERGYVRGKLLTFN